MNGIQVVLITAVVLVAIYFIVRLHNSNLDFLLLLAMVTAALVFIFWDCYCYGCNNHCQPGSYFWFFYTYQRSHSLKPMAQIEN